MDLLTLTGLGLNALGSIILAVSLHETTRRIDYSITALEIFKDTLLSRGDIQSIIGMDIHRKKAMSKSNLLTNLGLFLLIFGFLLQIFSLLIS